MLEEIQIAPNSILRPYPEQIATQVNHQIVILNLAKGKYVGFDDIATNIWQRIEQTTTVVQLCQEIAAEYTGDPLQIKHDVLEFLAQLQTLSLIIIEPSTP